MTTRIEPYLEALRSVNLEAILVTPSRPLPSLAGVDGLVVSGGTMWIRPSMDRKRSPALNLRSRTGMRWSAA